MHPVADTWVYLSASPLLWLTLTLVAYLFAFMLYRRSRLNPLVNPVAIAVCLLLAVLLGTHTTYQTYFDGAQFVHFLLGPATVALAIPLYEQWGKLRSHWVALVVALLVGLLVASTSAVLIAHLLGASPRTLASLVPKSITTPVAMSLSEKLGGIPSLTAVCVVITGIVGSALARFVLNAMRIPSHAVRGFALGLSAHGQGVARAFQVSAEMGAFAGLGMGLSALTAALLLPYYGRWLLALLS
ncbi:MAG: LrgB family protein [Burkholderiaceae bacterium]